MAVPESSSTEIAMAAALSPSALDPSFAQAFNLSSRPTSTKKIWYAGSMVFWSSTNRPDASLCMQSLHPVKSNSTASAELQSSYDLLH
jgi:hypothetical protein